METLQRFKFTLGILLFFGTMTIFSASFYASHELYGNHYTLFSKHLISLVISLSVMALIARTPFSFWVKYGIHLHALAIILLLLTLVPQVTVTVKGASRWISLGHFHFQPGELVKFTILLPCISYLQNFAYWRWYQHVGLLLFFLFPAAIFLKQPDFGVFVLYFMGPLYLCFLGPLPRKYLWSLFGSFGVVIAGTLFAAPYRVQRLISFLDPWKDPYKSGFQIIQSYLAFANGHWIGKGLGLGQQKLLFLPESYNDFIFSIVGEEWGFVGVFLIIILFLLFIYWGFSLAEEASQPSATLFISSVTFLIGLQAILNMGVVLGLLPTKGLNLPFVSYGGSSLVANCFILGLVFSIFRGDKKSY